MPLPYKKILWTTWGYQPFFIQQLGVFSTLEINSAINLAFMQAIPKKWYKITFFGNEAMSKHLPPNYNFTPRNNYILPLSFNYTTLQQQYNSNTCRNIEKANKQALTIKKNIAVKTVVNFYKQEVGSKLPHIKNKHYQQLITLIETANTKKYSETWGVFKNNTLIAVNWIAKSNNRLYNLLPASNAEGKQCKAMFFLIDELIQSNCNTPLILDFEGSMVAGIAQFYAGFGAKLSHYFAYQHKKTLLL